MEAKTRHAGGMDRSVLWSLAGHGLLVLLVLLGGLTLPRMPPPSQLAIKATLVDPMTVRRPPSPPRRPAPKPEPEPEPEPEPAPPPEREPEPPPPDPAEQAAERRQLEEAKAAAVRKQQAEARQKAEKARQEKARQVQQAREQKARDDKAAAERARAEAERKKQEAREKAEAERAARELERQLAEEERLLAATESGALADYIAVIRQRVERNWVRPPGARAGLECEVLVAQIPGGEVTNVQIGRCNADDAVRRSIEAAVLRASPLPLPDDPALFERNLRFTFKPEQ